MSVSNIIPHLSEKGYKNRVKARNRLSRKHLKVIRQRKDFAVSWQGASSSLRTWLPMRTCRCGIRLKTASCPSRFLMLHGLTSTVGWSISAKCSEWWQWLSHLTTERQNCSNCGESVKKSLSQRTHRCSQCGHIQDRDWNAALNILELGLRTVGHTGTLNA